MKELFDFQRWAVDELNKGKHICVSGMGCLAKGTPIVMSNGDVRSVEKIKAGDIVLSHDDETGNIVRNEVEDVIRTCHKPKPMIEFKYGNETITTTYDHPFYNGEGYYPIYQLVWGTLETSQRVQLKLLCEQYGTPFNDKAVWCKHSSSNASSKGQNWTLEDTDGRKDSQSSQNSSRKLAEEPRKLTFYQSHQLRSDRQQSREPRVLHPKIQRLVFVSDEKDSSSKNKEPFEIKDRRQGVCQGLLPEEHAEPKRCREENPLRQASGKVSKCKTRHYTSLGEWKVEIKTAEPYYSISLRQAPYTYCIGREHHFITHNTGKTAMMMTWLKEKCEQTGKNKILIVTTPSKRDSGDMEAEADDWCGDGWRTSLSSFEVISWHGLAKWEKNLKFGEAKNYVFGFDEVAKAGAGISSGMGTAFLKITKQTRDWAGFTGTPGDTWMKFYPYFVATGKVRNKTAFRNRYVQEQTFKGFPEIVGYNFVDELDRMWRDIAVIPDTSVVESQLPEETSRTIHFKTPTGYRDIIRTRRDKDGNLLETNMALCHYLRQACFSKQRQQWLSDFIENLGTNCVFFCNYIEEEETLCEIANKVLPDGAKVWRIDGSHHDIPTAETIGKYDIVVAHYASGGEALNLQFINYWVSVSPNYSYSVSKQAKGRIRRIGQRKPMFFFHMKCDGTIEDAVFASLQAKKVFSEKEWCIANNINEGE